MAKRKYKAREGSPITDEQANVVGSEVETMRKDGYAVTPRNLVETARPKKNPLHALFEWDDESAADKWRVAWARKLLGAVLIIEIKSKQPRKAFYSVGLEVEDNAPQRIYERRQVVLANSDALHQVSCDLYARVRSATKDAEQLGLTRYPYWKSICEAVSRNEPPEVNLDTTA